MQDFLILLQELLWSPIMLFAFVTTGLYFSIQSGFFQLFHFPTWMRLTLIHTLFTKQQATSYTSITPYQALCTSLAATVGTGNIVGVATAIVIGGPGAVFWMWVSAFLGMMTSFAEKSLGIRYRYHNSSGEWIGGAMVYLERGVHSRLLALLYSILCIIVSLGMGNMVQGNTISESLSYAFGVTPSITAAFLTILVALIILGGGKRIIQVTEMLVPFMSLFYITAGLIVLCYHHTKLLPAIQLILTSAISPQSVGGGLIGYSVLTAMRVGISRGVFSNEAGLGSSVMAHSASNNNDPAIQGMWGICEVFIDTILLCSITALVILVSGIYDVNTYLYQMQKGTSMLTGASLTSASFSTVLPYGNLFLAISIILFAFATMIGWSYFGERSILYLFGSKGILPYKILYVITIYFGCTLSLELVWSLSDIFNALLSIPNLYALFILRKEVVYLMKQRLWCL